MNQPDLSVVIPIYNEEEIIPELDRRLRTFLTDDQHLDLVVAEALSLKAWHIMRAGY